VSNDNRCNRCGVVYDIYHTCSHPEHITIDPDCVYWGGDITGTKRCEICWAVRTLFADMIEDVIAELGGS